MKSSPYKALNSSQRKKMFAQVSNSLNAKEFVILQKEKKFYITTPIAAKLFMESQRARSVGLFLGEWKDNALHLSSSAEDLFRKK